MGGADDVGAPPTHLAASVRLSVQREVDVDVDGGGGPVRAVTCGQ